MIRCKSLCRISYRVLLLKLGALKLNEMPNEDMHKHCIDLPEVQA
jgi:hypothetical protein